jgi:hypothetical protein
MSDCKEKRNNRGGLLGKWGTSLEIGEVGQQINDWTRLSTANDYKVNLKTH